MASHAETVRRYGIPGECEVITERGAYPYECQRKDEQPDALVSVCARHLVWWIEDETNEGSKHLMMTTRDIAEETLRGGAYDGPEIYNGEWAIKINPHAGTVTVRRGTRYGYGSTTPDDTEPITVRGVQYSVNALFTLDEFGAWELDRLSAFRPEDGRDATPGARAKLAEMVKEQMQALPNKAEIGAAMKWHRGALRVQGLEAKVAELEKELAQARHEMDEAKSQLL